MSIVFKPWIGKEYFSQTPKILVLGESHYFEEGESHPNSTIEIVRSCALREGTKKLRFFSTVAMILSGQPYQWLSDEKAREFWNKVAFYNFVQSSVGTKARIRPTEGMWLNSEIAFNSVLSEHQPDIIVVLGKELRAKIGHLDSSHRNSIFCYWTHPSTPKYFKKQEAMDSFQDALNLWKLGQE